MKRTILAFMVLAVIGLMCRPVFADRNVATNTKYDVSTDNGLIKRGNGKVYRINFQATANNGYFYLYDSTSNGSADDIKVIGSQATSKNSALLDYSQKPLEFSTGLYLYGTDCSLVISYE